jgi:hypothetical protein
MLYWLLLALLFGYYIVGDRLTAQAMRYLREPRRRWSASPLYRPENFTSEGEASRLRAIRWWQRGGIAVALILVALVAFTQLM